jgi:GrpB-like predicted nucleotidyltransferase (UPF0157 family)
MGRFIEVVSADATWSATFDREAADLTRVFGQMLVGIHHIGSTSVPALPAKPIIDILVVLRETATIARFDGAMEALGYRVRGECLDAEVPGTPGRYYFSKDTQGVRSHQVHACAANHPEVAEKLAFRDYLRTHPQQAAAYGELKHRLARDHPHDIVSYIRGKDLFIKSLLEDARYWCRSRS